MLANGCGARKSVGVHSLWHGAVQRVNLWRHLANVARKKPVSLALRVFGDQHLRDRARTGLCRDVRRGLFWSHKVHRSVTTDILLQDMFLRCDTRHKGNLTKLTDIVFVRQEEKRDRVPRWRWIVDGFPSDSRASKDAN